MIVYDNQLSRYGRFNRYGSVAQLGPEFPGYDTSPPLMARDDTPTAVIDPLTAITSVSPGVIQVPMPGQELQASPAPVPSKIPWLVSAGVLATVAYLLGR